MILPISTHASAPLSPITLPEAATEGVPHPSSAWVGPEELQPPILPEITPEFGILKVGHTKRRLPKEPPFFMRDQDNKESYLTTDCKGLTRLTTP
jgi:hypothetical protein